MLIVLALALSIFGAMPSAIAEQTGPDAPYTGGSWILDSSGITVIRNETLEITGDFLITAGSTLIIENCEIIVNFSGAHKTIEMALGATLEIRDSTIVDNLPVDTTQAYRFLIHGSSQSTITFHNVHSTDINFQIAIEVLGVLTITDSTFDGQEDVFSTYGLVTYDTVAYIENVTFTNYQFGYFIDSEVTIKDYEFYGNPSYTGWDTAIWQDGGSISVDGIISNTFNCIYVEYTDTASDLDLTNGTFYAPLTTILNRTALEGAIFFEPGPNMMVTADNVYVEGMANAVVFWEYSAEIMNHRLLFYDWNLMDVDNIGYMYSTGGSLSTSDATLKADFFDFTHTNLTTGAIINSDSTGWGAGSFRFFNCGINSSMIDQSGAPLTSYGLNLEIWNLITLYATNNEVHFDGGILEIKDVWTRNVYETEFYDGMQVYALDQIVQKYIIPQYNCTAELTYGGNIQSIKFLAGEVDTITFEFNLPVISTDMPDEVTVGEYDMTITGESEFTSLIYDVIDEFPTVPIRNGSFEGNASIYKTELNLTYSITQPVMDGVFSSDEWAEADMARFYYYPDSGHPDAYLYVYGLCTDIGIYLLVDVTGDDTDDYGDYAEFAFDMNSNETVWDDDDDYISVVHAVSMGYMEFEEEIYGGFGIGNWPGITNTSESCGSSANCERGFGSTPNSHDDHAFYEFFYPFDGAYVDGWGLNQSIPFYAEGYGTLAPVWTFPNWQFIGDNPGFVSQDWEWPLVDFNASNWAVMNIPESVLMDGELEFNFTEPGTHYVRIRATDENGTSYMLKTITVLPYDPVVTYEGDTNITVEGTADEMEFTVTMDISPDVAEMDINISEDSEFYGWETNLTVYDDLGSEVFTDEFYDETTVVFEHNSDYTFSFLFSPPTTYTPTAGTTDILTGTITFTPIDPLGEPGEPLEFAVEMTVIEPADVVADYLLYILLGIFAGAVITGLVLWRRKGGFNHGTRGPPIEYPRQSMEEIRARGYYSPPESESKKR